MSAEDEVAIFRVHAPARLMVIGWLLAVSIVANSVGLAVFMGSAMLDGGWRPIGVVVMGLVLGGTMFSQFEFTVPWWVEVHLGTDGFVLRRGRHPLAWASLPSHAGTVTYWRDIQPVRVLVGSVARPSGGDPLTRVTLQLDAAAAGRVWNAPPFHGFGPYRAGLGWWLKRNRGLSWTLGDLDAPAAEVVQVMNAVLPEDEVVDVTAHDVSLVYHHPRYWPLVFMMLFFGIPLLGLLIFGD